MRGAMVRRKMEREPVEVVERAEFVGRTVQEMCELLRAGASYPQVLERIERARCGRIEVGPCGSAIVS